MGAPRRRRQFRRRDQLPVPGPPGQHGLRRPDRLGTKPRADDHAGLSRFPAEGAGGAWRPCRPENGTRDRPVPERVLGRQNLPARLLLQRTGEGWEEGARPAPRRAPCARIELDGHDALPAPAEHVRRALSEGHAVVLAGRTARRDALPPEHGPRMTEPPNSTAALVAARPA